MNSPALDYRPVYLGLFAAQALAIACNVFLDIQYGGFTAEVIVWSIAFGHSLKVGWRQHGVTNEDGNRLMRRYLIFGGILSVIMFIPMWGFPRAGLYMLAVLQAAHNCITTTRRQLHMGLLMSLVMVIFASSHYRADWTMLFYLIPYVAAVVFTLVAEQINRRSNELRQQSLGNQVVGGQMTAIAAATTAILALGLLLYVVTPQINIMSLYSNWGNPTDIGPGGDQTKIGKGGKLPSSGGNGAEKSSSGSGQGLGSGSGWPTPQEMRQAGSRKGMPDWQRGAIYKLADATEWASVTLKPVMKYFHDLWEAFKKWLEENRQKVIAGLIFIGLIALLFALWRLMREAKVTTWIQTRIDYFRLGILGLHGEGSPVADRYYRAMSRLFELGDIQRSPQENTREYLAEINSFYRDMAAEAGAITRIFEDTRYGPKQLNTQNIQDLRQLYRKVYRSLSRL